MSYVRTGILALAVLLPAGIARAEDAPLTPKTLQSALAAHPTGADATALADRIRAYFGKSRLSQDPQPKVDEVTVAWAIEAPDATAAPVVASDDGTFRQALDRVGDTPVYAAVVTLPDKAGMLWHYQIGDRKLADHPLEVYKTDPDSLPNPNVPHGTTTKMPPWESKIFPDSTRDWWVYVPAQYKPESPACVMVFQDGSGPSKYVPPVFDNLIAKGQMPVTVGIFINPGTRNGRSERSFEYDTLSDQYARFLLEEILPEVEKTVKLRHDAPSRAISGASSGGICAFTVAWERPNEFSKVLSWVGSFTNIASGPTFREGGHNYEAMIRKAPKRAIRVLLQDGEHDLDNDNGNWPLAAQSMAKSLKFAGYDYRFEYGHGFHSGKHGQAILPDSLRWLWRDYKP